MPNDSSWISLTWKVILCERQQQSWSPFCPVLEAMREILQPLASGPLDFPQTSLLASLGGYGCPQIRQQLIKGGIIGPCSFPVLGETAKDPMLSYIPPGSFL